MSMIPFKFKVYIWEYERHWGSKIDEVREFDTYKEAVECIEKTNAENTLSEAPDLYWVAEPANFTITKD